MKKIVLLMAAAALVLFMSCSNSSGGGDGSGGSGETVNVKSDLLGKNILVKDFSKYSAIGAASSKAGASGNIAAGISANTSSDSDAEKNAHLVGQDSDGNVEDLSLETEGQGSDLNQRPLQFFRAFKRFVFFMYWPKQPENNQNSNGGYYVGPSFSYPDYGKLLNSPQYFTSPSGFDPKTGVISYTYEPMFVLDKSNGKIYAIDTDEGNNSNYSSSSSSKWSCLYYNTGSNSNSGLYNSSIADCGDRFYIRYTSYNYSSSGMPSTSTINLYGLKLTDNQLQESYIVKNGDMNLFGEMYVDRFGNLFVNGSSNSSNSNIKYYMAFDGSKTKINCADNLHVYNSDSSLYSVYYNPDETFTYNYSSTADCIYYAKVYETSSNYYLDAMEPKLCTPLFMAANGYVYQADKESSSRAGVYKRYNADGQLEACDWVPEGSQEFYFTPDELVKEDATVNYYFVAYSYSTNFNNSYGGLSKTFENLQLLNSSGQPAKVKKYDFTNSRFTDEEIPVVLKSYKAEYYSYSTDSYKSPNTIYKVQFTDSSKDQFTVTAIPLEGFDTSNSYYYYYGCNNYAVTKKHIFFIKDGDLIAYNIENGKKDASCSRSNMIFGTVYPSEDPSKINFTATSLTDNSSIRGSIDDNGNMSKSSTSYEIKYLSPIN